MTAQTSHVVRQECESIDRSTHLDEFIQSSEDIVFFQYRYVVKIVIGPGVGKPSEALEVRSYRQAHELLQELTAKGADTTFRAWPHTFTRTLDAEGRIETCLLVFCGKGGDVVTEEEAWARFGGSDNLDTEDEITGRQTGGDPTAQRCEGKSQSLGKRAGFLWPRRLKRSRSYAATSTGARLQEVG
jgi:hypothetical protein